MDFFEKLVFLFCTTRCMIQKASTKSRFFTICHWRKKKKNTFYTEIFILKMCISLAKKRTANQLFIEEK